MTQAASGAIADRGINYPLLLATVSLASFVGPLNSTMLAVALPDIRDAFGVSHVAVAWLASAYLIGMAVAQPLGGRLGDQLGRAKMLRIGLILFLAFSLLAVVAPSFPLLVLTRTGQAVVGAAMIPNGAAMLRVSAPRAKLGEANGLITLAAGMGASLGPLVGVALLAFGSWRLLFAANLPFVFAALVCHARLRYRDEARQSQVEIDWIGAFALTCLLVVVSYFLGTLRGGAGLLAYVVIAAAFVASAGVFYVRQRTSALPLIEWRLFRVGSYLAATIYVLTSYLVIYTTLLAMPFFVKEVLGKSPGTAGLLLGAFSVLMALVAPFGGRLSDERGRRTPAIMGALLQALGATLLAVAVARHASVPFLGFSLSLIGCGMGLGFGAATTAAIEAAPRELAGAASGTSSMMRYMGSVLGAGVLGSFLTSDSGTASNTAFVLLFVLLTICALTAAFSALFIHRFTNEHGSPTLAHLRGA